ncbi:uncharacterized protein PAC_00565 [Phialocephala subalpina]|uniref:RING-type domain-containing protein n=1 Tax=Phialocephala subalpina TaxID=576137 RepID=A0A1L7WD31_9HELO|nr:uncharacterized protein PAC_00565 [Phialocephala subalpina]
MVERTKEVVDKSYHGEIVTRISPSQDNVNVNLELGRCDEDLRPSAFSSLTTSPTQEYHDTQRRTANTTSSILNRTNFLTTLLQNCERYLTALVFTMSSLPRVDAVAAQNPPDHHQNQNHSLLPNVYSHSSLTPPSSKSASIKSHSMKDKKKRSREDTESGSRETTPTELYKSKRREELSTQRGDKLKADLLHIKSTVTCTICVQLLYEPYTLGCGHTYCYGCLCTWFVQHRHRKTCPDCRTIVKQVPAQNYTVKTIVELLAKNEDLMPTDESVEQHIHNREEEAAEIENDKSDKGLFKGLFPNKPAGARLMYDEEDGVFRCPTCNHEHEGGPLCTVCGEQFGGDPYAYSDYDEDEEDEHLDNIAVDLDVDEVEIDFAHMHNHRRFMDQPHFVAAHAHAAHYPHHFHHPAILSEASEVSGSDDSRVTDDSEYESDSLDGFVVRDEQPAREPVRGASGRFIDLATPEPALPRQREEIDLVSDSESDDEGGAISNGRSRRRRIPGAFDSSSPPPPAVPDALSISDDSNQESDFDETLSEAEQALHNAGWSPLDNGNESEIEAQTPYDEYEYGGYATTEEEREDQRSDTTTETIGGNAAVYNEEEDESQEDLSDTPHSRTPTYNGEGYARGSTYADFGAYDAYAADYQYLGEDDGDESAHEYSAVEGASIDGDGDTEMSVSSSRSNTHSVSAAAPNTYAADYNEHYETRDRGASVTDDGHPDDESNYGYSMSVPNTYVANAMPEGEEDSSDSSIRPPPRRQPRQPRRYVQPAREDVQIFHHTNPFTPQPHIRQGGRANPIHVEIGGRGGGSRRDPIQLDGASDNRADEFRNWGGELRRFMEPASRDRRMTAYRQMPARRVDPLRSSRSPSATRIISSSSRASRVPRQYLRRS